MLDTAETTSNSSPVIDVTIHETLNKDGLTTEIISARTAKGLYDYFKLKNLEITEGEIPVLEKYIGKNYSFIASWVNKNENSDQNIVSTAFDKYFSYGNFQGGLIQTSRTTLETLYNYPEFLQSQPSNGESFDPTPYEIDFLMQHPDVRKIIIDKIVNDPVALKEIKDYMTINDPASMPGQQRGVFVTFPTDKIFFPLMPTSVYGSLEVPAVIRVVGFITPEVFNDIKPYTKTEYFSQDYFYEQSELTTFFKGAVKDRHLKYTKIEIKAPSKLFTDDLWFNQNTPAKITFMSNIASNPWVVGILMFLIISFASGMLVGTILFRPQISKAYIFGLLGLFNFLTVVGFAIATFLWPTKELNDPQVVQFMREHKMSTFGLRVFDWRKFIFVPAVSLMITILLWAVIIFANKYLGVGNRVPFL